jgi:hypothetical protein
VRKLIPSALMLAVAVLVGTVILRYHAEHTEQLCQVCNRPVHAGMGYRLELSTRSEIACCPRCGMHYELLHTAAVKTAFARDFYTGTEIPAQKAFYVEGGNQVYCAHVQPVERKGIQSSAQLAYDRCIPALVAFANAGGADKYRAEHGGRLLNFAEAQESVRER